MSKICVFVGSIRNGRQGRKVANWVAATLSKQGHDATIIDPEEHPDLQVMRRMFKSEKNPSEDFQKVRDLVNSADGYIAITPEYNHSFSGALKSMLDCFLEEYNFKPFGIVTYSAGGFGGIRAAEQLRCVVAEMGAPATPTSLSISKVQNVFSEDGSLLDNAYNARLERMLTEFHWYVEAFANQRSKGTPY